MILLRIIRLMLATFYVARAWCATSTEWIKLGMAPSVAPQGKPYPVFYSSAIERRGILAVAHVYSNNEGPQGSEMDIFRLDCGTNLWN